MAHTHTGNEAGHSDRVTTDLRSRFLHYLMLERAVPPTGDAPEPVDPEQWQHKLAVEQDALLARWQHRQQAQAQRDAARHQFLNHFRRRLAQTLAEPGALIQDTALARPQFELLDLLLQPHPSRARVLGLLTDMSWLGEALLRHLNSPKERAQRRDVAFTDARLACNYLGIEQLQALLPWLIFQHWGHSRHAQLGLRQRKLWRFAHQHGEAAAKVARARGVAPQAARLLALVRALDWVLALQLGAREFNRLQEHWLEEARREGAKAAHEAVFGLKLPGQPLVALLSQGAPWTLQLLKAFELEESRLYQEVRRLYLPAPAGWPPLTQAVNHSHEATMLAFVRQRQLATPEELARWQRPRR
ncbi:HDOD domain-containing protein [Ferrimonas balearica]|uniref:HDOD domain-containing protein n=1 Tax=Ferrimonas balearica TaxID=44012 RepID=UPI001C99042D|nr:HDOD domain-containing protein [Ferrimonas balearica]MBY5993065.1 hypothetical protein [Ferrimonas balearica]